MCHQVTFRLAKDGDLISSVQYFRQHPKAVALFSLLTIADSLLHPCEMANLIILVHYEPY